MTSSPSLSYDDHLVSVASAVNRIEGGQGNLNSSPRTALREAEDWLTMSVSGTSDPSAVVRAWPAEEEHEVKPVLDQAAKEELDLTPVDQVAEKELDLTPVDLASSLAAENGMESAQALPGQSTHEVPRKYVDVIENAFGADSDLYADILRLERSSSPREIRIAYFRRGREVLSDDEHPAFSSEEAANGEVSTVAKQRFQAVSAAYEVLSNPAWKKIYDKVGFDHYEEGASKSSGADQIKYSSKTALRSSLSSNRRVRSQNAAVRWSGEVEEVVFDQIPQESSSQDDSAADAQKTKRKNRKKKRVVVDSEELELHLEKLDKEAARHFVSDFLDDLESSVEGLLSLGSRRKAELRRVEAEKEEAEREEAEREEAEREREEREREVFGYDDDDSDATDEPQRDEPAANMHATDRNVNRVDDELTHQPRNAMDANDKHRSVHISTDESATRDIDACDGDPTLRLAKTDSVVRGAQSSPSPAETRQSSDVAGHMDASEVSYNTGDRFRRDDSNVDDSPVPWTSDGDKKEEREVNNGSDKSPGFIVFLLTYLKSLACDLNGWGSLEWESEACSLMDTMMLTEEDLDGMLGILRTEIDRTPIGFE